MKLRVGVITAGRNDFGIYLPVLRALREAEEFDPVVMATGTHMDPRFGETVKEMASAGFAPDFQVPMVPASDGALGVASIMGEGIVALARVYETAQLDLLMLLGDRFEMFAAATAAVPFRMPLVHLHGGEVTEGAIDEQFRHAISKMAHFHFVSTERYRDRLLQMGEEPWRVVVSGAPALDHLNNFTPWPRERLEVSLQLSLERPPLLVTFHPVTLRDGEQVGELLSALESINDRPIIITGTNSDPGYSHIMARFEAFVAVHPNAMLVSSLGVERYFSLMSYASAMVGNSSSGIIEAASFGLPVVNIGDRQKGRVRGRNVIDVPCERSAIGEAIRSSLSASFRDGLHSLRNPYYAGGAADRIVESLKFAADEPLLLNKRFKDWTGK